MKRIYIIILLFCLSACSLSAQKTTLSGTLTNLPDESVVILDQVAGNQLQHVDTLRLDAKGTFKITLTPQQPTLYLLHTAKPDDGVCHLLLGPKEKVSVDIVHVSDRQAFKIMSCKGSRNVDLYRQFNDIVLGAANPAMQAMLPYQIEKLLTDNKDVLMSAFLSTIFEEDFDNHVQLFIQIRDALIKDYPNDPFVQHLNDRLRNTLLPGMEAPDIAMKDPDSNIRKLSDLRGHVVMIDFWASWCGPCRRENPNVVKLYHKYHDKGFEIYSVSLDKDRASWLKAIKDDGLVWPNHVSDLNYWTSSGGKTYGINSVPATVLVDKDGKIIARNLRGADLEKKLAEIFN